MFEVLDSEATKLPHSEPWDSKAYICSWCMESGEIVMPDTHMQDTSTVWLFNHVSEPIRPHKKMLAEMQARIDAADLSFDGLSLQYPDVGQVFVPVEPSQGGAVVSGAGVLRQALPPNRPASLSFGAVNANGRFEPQRFFLPFWKNQQSGQ